MDDTEFAQRRKNLEDELSELESATGIAPEAAEKAWGRAFIPYGVVGDEMQEFTAAPNNTLCFDNEHDDRARRAAVMSATETVTSAEESPHPLLTRQRFSTLVEATTGNKDDGHFGMRSAGVCASSGSTTLVSCPRRNST